MSSEQLWQSFCTFANTVQRIAQQHLPVTKQEQIAQWLPPRVVFSAEACSALRNYFQIPAHVVAVNQLDHSQFLNDLVLGGSDPTIPLRQVLEDFSKIGPQSHGEVWLALLDVAEICNPTDIHAAPGRAFIQRQVGVVSASHRPQPTTAPPLTMPDPAQLDSILGSVLSAFPGLQQCVTSLMNSSQSGADPDLNSVVDQVQNTLLDPIVQSIRTNNPDQAPLENAERA